MQVSVRVKTGVKKERVEEQKSGRLGVFVKTAPKQGAANARVVELVAKHFGVAQKKVRIIRGHKSPSKILEVE
jgi:hypothetical protein